MCENHKILVRLLNWSRGFRADNVYSHTIIALNEFEAKFVMATAAELGCKGSSQQLLLALVELGVFPNGASEYRRNVARCSRFPKPLLGH